MKLYILINNNHLFNAERKAVYGGHLLKTMAYFAGQRYEEKGFTGWSRTDVLCNNSIEQRKLWNGYEISA